MALCRYVLRSLVDQVLPPCVVVDDNQLVIHAFGELDRYLTVPRGFQVDFNILKMARPEVALPLSTALHRTAHGGEAVVYRRIGIPTIDGVHHFDLSTRVFWEKANRRQLFLVIFTPSQDHDVTPATEDHYDISGMTQQRISNLEQELQYTRENLQATIEELETANEELQATNEELMAANEELQSTNEELQSVNEELITVNTELQFKIQELTNLNDDMANLLRSTDIGTIFLDANLRLRRFTPAAQAVINVLEQDIGRPFEHITTGLKEVNLPALALQVRDTLKVEEMQVQSRTDRWYQLKVLPYRTHTGQMGGVVLTLVDTTQLNHTEALLRDFEQARRYLDAIGSLVVVLDGTGRVDFINVLGAQLLGYEVHELIGVDWFETCVIATERQRERADFFRVMNSRGENWDHHESRLLARDGSERWFAWDNTRLHNPDSGRDLLLRSGRDLTDHFTAANTALQKQDILDQSTDVIFIRDVLDRITDWGKAAERYYGYSQEEAIGRNVYELLRIELPEPRDAIMSRFLGTGHWEGDVVHVGRDGRRLHLHSRWSLQQDFHSETQSYLEFVSLLQPAPPLSSMS
ncbi:MAG: PAS domain S-box protein [Anaerolineales bacterium]|nr:PAS domain S-box protein [Anaerolineales bacterium]